MDLREAEGISSSRTGGRRACGLRPVLPQLLHLPGQGRNLSGESVCQAGNRGKGYGKALLRKLAQITVERGCGRLEWSYLDWNKPSIDFYLSLNAAPMDQWTVYRLTGDTLRELANS